MGPRLIVSSDELDDDQLSDVGSYVSEELEAYAHDDNDDAKPLELAEEDDDDNDIDDNDIDEDEDDDYDSTPVAKPSAVATKLTKKRVISEVDDDGLDDDDEEEVYEASLTLRRRKLDNDAVMELPNLRQRSRNEEQIALRKAELARRRADYKSKAEEEEKRDTVNKLLKRRAAKAKEGDEADDEAKLAAYKPRRPMLSHPALWTFVSTKEKETLTVHGVL